MSADFLSSMTFANGNNDLGCDCDECEVSALPAPIMEAVRKRKREILLARPLFSTQERTLISRQEGVAIWKTVVPVGAEPLVEFGQSHRILWVKQLESQKCHLRSIGEGIIGSSDEEESRKQLDWEKGDIFLVKSNGGKAVGWTHCLNEGKKIDDTTTGDGIEPAILITIKIPLSKIKDVEPVGEQFPNVEDVTSDSWASYFLKIAQILVETDQEYSPGIFKLSEAHRKAVRHALQKVQVKDGALPMGGTVETTVDPFSLVAEAVPTFTPNPPVNTQPITTVQQGIQ